MADSTGVVLSFVATGSCSRTRYQNKSNIENGAHVFDGELEDITHAMEWATLQEQDNKHFQVFSDNQAALYRLKKPSDNPGQACQLRAVAAARIIQSKNSTINLNWIPDHLGIGGNEEADRFA